MKKKSKLVSVIVIAAIVAVIAALYFSHRTISDRKVNKAGAYVVKYLDAKYHRNFAVKSGHYIFNTGGYEFTVYPKDDPHFKFHAWLNSMTESGVSDQYLYFNHRRTAFKWIQPYLDKISKDNYIDSANPGEMGKDKLLSAMYKSNLTLPEMLKQFPNKMNIFVRAHINYNITPKNTDQVLKKVYDLLVFLRQKKFGYIEINLYFYNLPNKNINHMFSNNKNLTGGYSAFGSSYWLGITPNIANQIKNYKQLKGYLMKRKPNWEELKNVTN